MELTGDVYSFERPELATHPNRSNMRFKVLLERAPAEPPRVNSPYPFVEIAMDVPDPWRFCKPGDTVTIRGVLEQKSERDDLNRYFERGVFVNTGSPVPRVTPEELVEVHDWTEKRGAASIYVYKWVVLEATLTQKPSSEGVITLTVGDHDLTIRPFASTLSAGGISHQQQFRDFQVGQTLKFLGIVASTQVGELFLANAVLVE